MKTVPEKKLKQLLIHIIIRQINSFIRIAYHTQRTDLFPRLEMRSVPRVPPPVTFFRTVILKKSPHFQKVRDAWYHSWSTEGKNTLL